MEETPVTLPIDHPRPLDPPAGLDELRSRGPLTPMTFPDGHVGWLVTGYDAVCTLLTDSRLSSRRDLIRMPVDMGFETFSRVPAEPGNFLRMDPPEHTRYRRLLTSQFTFRRVKQLEPLMTKVTQECLDAMERSGPPVDLMTAFAQPIPALVAGELFGFPSEASDVFRQSMTTMLDLDASDEEKGQALAALMGIFGSLIASRRTTPTDDFYSDLVNSGELTDEELTNLGFILFGAGYETTVNMLSLGTFALLEHPDQLALLRSDPDVVDGAVEELLRYLTTVHVGVVRAALEDIEIAGRLIRKGQSVSLSLPAANWDPARFENPERLDVTRSAQGHVAFGHGLHQCLGQQFARAEMRIALPALFKRFPNLRLDIPAKDVPMQDRSLTYGVLRLPVAW
jgi:cytochrome P450